MCDYLPEDHWTNQLYKEFENLKEQRVDLEKQLQKAEIDVIDYHAQLQQRLQIKIDVRDDIRKELQKTQRKIRNLEQGMKNLDIFEHVMKAAEYFSQDKIKAAKEHFELLLNPDTTREEFLKSSNKL
jgi:hypothetical protein